MKNGILTIASFLSVILFPWPLTAFVAIAASFFEPLVPLAVGLFADTLYWAPDAGALPVYSFYGLAFSIVAIFVRSRLSTSIIGE